ncbi:hypothetical protein JZ751_013763 [Albula glossodonta]|uniref:Uncharacterized protein n=1 Tax=Albula glossodonta TaxID=121402 RepID=A0A8T2NRP6_9TELE|nr:hypothetical protein JZ751_013763 [Albula glossodonta]
MVDLERFGEQAVLPLGAVGEIVTDAPQLGARCSDRVCGVVVALDQLIAAGGQPRPQVPQQSLRLIYAPAAVREPRLLLHQSIQ